MSITKTKLEGKQTFSVIYSGLPPPATLNRTLRGNHNNQPLKSPLNVMNAKHLKTKNNFYYASLEYHQHRNS